MFFNHDKDHYYERSVLPNGGKRYHVLLREGHVFRVWIGHIVVEYHVVLVVRLPFRWIFKNGIDIIKVLWQHYLLSLLIQILRHV